MKTKAFFFPLVVSIVLISCTKNAGGGNNNNPQPVTPPVTPTPTRLITLPAGWKFSNLLSSNFPTGIELYFFDTLFEGKKTKAFCLAYDSKRTIFEFKPVLSATAK
ncbi:MAG: hypothetical protein ACK46Z_04410, partial [Bacteroidota bacterium]